MKKNDIIHLAHIILNAHISKEDIVVDATMGNGHDTVFLAKLAKHVFAFDIQKQALDNTMKLLEAHQLSNVTLFHETHEHIVGLVSDFKGVVFNLGYLPNGDHSITTKKETTLKTLDMLLSVLRPTHFILIVVYPGHQEGYEESLAIDDYLKSVDSASFSIIRSDLPYQDHRPPYLLFIQKI